MKFREINLLNLDLSWVQWVDIKSGCCYLHINYYCQICASEVAQALALLYQLKHGQANREAGERVLQRGV